MEILDETTTEIKRYFKHNWNKRILIFIALLCLLFQVEAMLGYIAYMEPDINGMVSLSCFYSPYSFRILLVPIMIFGMILSWHAFNINGRVFPQEQFDKLILGSPLIILSIDLVLTLLFDFCF